MNQQPKRLREGSNPSPDIFNETPLTATLVEESSTVNPNFFSPETYVQKSNNYLAIKLNHLKDKTHKTGISQKILIVVYNPGSCTKRT